MKQHITIEQLKELNDDGVCQLNTLMNHEWNLTEEEFQKYTWEQILKDTSEYCTIGRMIEILVNYVPLIENDYIEDSIDIECDRKTKSFVVEYRKNNFEFVNHEADELCDALWETVKEILKQHPELKNTTTINIEMEVKE